MHDIPTSITQYFAPLPDPRVAHTKRHRLLDILTIALCAVICGADDFVGMVTFAETKHAWLRTFLPLPGGIPCHDTFGRVFAALDPEAFQACFLAWVRAAVPSTVGQVVAIDGKTLCGAHARGRGQAALHMVSAWASGSRLVLGQVAVAEKSNEITAIPALLRVLDLAGATVTIDALGCQTAIAARIVAHGADYILALKKNHPTLHEEVEATFTRERKEAFADTPPGTWDYCKAVGKDHGRLETRQHWVLRDPGLLAYLNPTGAWANLHAIALVERQRQVGDHPPTCERHYYLLSAPLSAQAFAAGVRSHWGIENRVHWLLDVTFSEDACRVRAGHAARNFAVIRHLALNLLPQDATRTGSLAKKRFTAARDDTYLSTPPRLGTPPHICPPLRCNRPGGLPPPAPNTCRDGRTVARKNPTVKPTPAPPGPREPDNGDQAVGQIADIARRLQVRAVMLQSFPHQRPMTLDSGVGHRNGGLESGTARGPNCGKSVARG